MPIAPTLEFGSQSPIPESVLFTTDGITFTWKAGTPEAGYIGPRLNWSEIRDASLNAAPPELRLHDGRTCFIPAPQRDDLRLALEAAGVPVTMRFDVWGLLLTRFLDSDWGPERKRRDVLAVHGIAGSEARRIQVRFGPRMIALAALTSEWGHFGMADLIEAHATFRRRPLSADAYQRFRRWADEVADRPRSTRARSAVI